MKKKTSISLSDAILVRIDQIAKDQERSRSWVIEKAITLGIDAFSNIDAAFVVADKDGARSVEILQVRPPKK